MSKSAPGCVFHLFLSSQLTPPLCSALLHFKITSMLIKKADMPVRPETEIEIAKQRKLPTRGPSLMSLGESVGSEGGLCMQHVCAL